MKRILVLSTFLAVLISVSACVSDRRRAEMEEQRIAQLRELAVEIVESEKDFFGDKARLDGLLEAIKTGKPKIEPDSHQLDADGERECWACVFGRDERGVFSVEIAFELTSRSPQGKLGFGLVDLVAREPLPDGGMRFRMRSIRPRRVTNYVCESGPGEQAKYDTTKGTSTSEKRNTALLKRLEDTQQLSP